ncbi:MAG: histidine kinase dimerization/phosphoacceptor domain -containing protein, partial [Sphingomicrobium sp.]
LEAEQIDRAPGLCASAILQNEPWVVADAARDPRSLANPLVAGEFGLRFYAAAPLRTRDGHNLGTLCVIDHEPRELSGEQIAQLESLAAIVMDQLELRLSAHRAIAEMSAAVEQKDAALRRADMLSKEVDHRVMNSLQLVSGLLNLQSRNVENAEARRELLLAASRVEAIARVHQNIYLSDDSEAGDCGEYLDRLCENLSAMLGDGENVRIGVECVEARLPSERIAPLGLIVNELVTNAAKNGADEIRVTLEQSPEGQFTLAVADNGSGLAEGFDPVAVQGLGMKVVCATAKQLGGTLYFGRDDALGGARFMVQFPGHTVHG